MSDLPMTPKNVALNYAKVNDFQVETFRIDGRTMYKAYGAAGIAEAQNYDRLLTKMRQLVDVATVAECTAPPVEEFKTTAPVAGDENLQLKAYAVCLAEQEDVFYTNVARQISKDRCGMEDVRIAGQRADLAAPYGRQKEKMERLGLLCREGAKTLLESFPKSKTGPWIVTLNGTTLQAKHSRAEAVKAVRRMLSGPNGFLYTAAHKLLIVYAP